MATGFEKDEIRDLSDVRMCISRRDRNAGDPKTFQVVDIVAKVSDLFQ